MLLKRTLWCVCCLPTLSQDPSDTGYLLTLRLPDGSSLGSPPHPHAPAQYNPPNPLSLPPPPPCLVSGDGLRRHLHSANLSRVSLTTSASRISARQHQTSLLVTKPVSSHHLPHSLASDHQPFSYFSDRLFFNVAQA